MGQSVIAGPSYFQPTIIEEFNLEWQVLAGNSFFKSAAGSGFVKGGFVISAPPAFQFPFYGNTFGPYITIDPAFLATDSTVFLAPTCDNSPFMTDLVGETVTGGTITPFAITAPMYTTSVNVTGTGGTSAAPISAIGLMTPI